MKRTVSLLLMMMIATAATAVAQTPLKQNKAGWVGLTAGTNNWLTPPLDGTWWRNEQHIQNLNLTADQQKKLDDVFLQFRLQLIELSASVTREEAILQPLLADVRAEDEARIVEAIDRAAMARAELEKVNARMLLRMRQVLTPEQWDRLSSGKKGFVFLK